MRLLCLFSVLYLSVNALPFFDEDVNGKEFTGKRWVILVAGSTGWGNYRHQADIYHAYQIVHSHGVPNENIIMFHYDDIANNKQNPTPGIVINKVNGSDVYHGVPKDYTGEDVNPDTFVKVLLGDKDLEAAGKKVLKAGPNDHVFIFFDDHGGPDLICFPHKYLYGEKLASTLKQMHDEKRYGKLVFYLETCESGSMFDKLLAKDINIYATTAAKPTEDSYAWTYDAKYKTYLGDVYSVKWMESSEKYDETYTLEQQFEYTRDHTNTSHVQQYGDLSIAKLPVAEFLGSKQSSESEIRESHAITWDVVNSRDLPLALAHKNFESAHDSAERQKYSEELVAIQNGRRFLDNHFTEYVNSIKHLTNSETNVILNTKLELNNRQCYHQFVDTFHDKCLNIAHNSYALSKLYIFVNICEQTTASGSAEALNNLVQYCQQNLAQGYSTLIH